MKIESGRKYFWQWELNRRLEVSEDCTQVHFANGTTDKALVLDVFEENGKRLVKVPDELLRVAAQLRCYAWNGASVIETESFDVLPREKPDDYVYEPEEVRRYEKLEAELNTRSQGRSAKYNFTTPGWKRVLNIIRGSGGMLTFCYGQSSPLYMAQVAGIVFSGFVKYGNDTSADTKPVLYQMYNNIFGEDDALENPGSITKVRIGYPDPDQDNYDNGTSDAIRNPVNCYLDVYVDFDKNALNSGSVGFQMNYAGYSDSHNCEAITGETNAVNVGIYGEKLLYHELTLDKKSGIYMPGWGIQAKEISADSMRVGGKKVLDAGDVDSALSSSSTNPVQNRVIKKAIDDAQKKGTSQVQFVFKASKVSTPLLFAGISSTESTAYLKDTDTKTPFLDVNGEPVDKKEAGAYVMAGVYGDINTGTLHAKAFDAETEFKVKGNPIIDDTKIGGSAWTSKNTVDKLCPSFTKNGDLVVCEPLVGYPLTVISYIGQDGASKITLRQDNEDESRDYTVDLPYDISDASYNWTTGMLITADDERIQLPPQVITALHGVNTFQSDCGDTTVSGRVDPNNYWGKKLAEQEAELAKLNKQYELIEEVTLEEDAASFTRTADPNGVPYGFSAVRVQIKAEIADKSQSLLSALGCATSSSYVYHQISNGLSTEVRHAHLMCRNDHGQLDYYAMSSNTNSAGNILARANYLGKAWQNITRINLTAATSVIPAGTTIKIYGIRG